jgi:hypothetical protein
VDNRFLQLRDNEPPGHTALRARYKYGALRQIVVIPGTWRHPLDG